MAEESRDAGEASSPEQAQPPDIGRMSFEDALQELRQIVEGLEQGETKLDQAIAAYQRGAELKKHCERKLKEAEAKIEKIREGEGGAVTTEPLDVE